MLPITRAFSASLALARRSRESFSRVECIYFPDISRVSKGRNSNCSDSNGWRVISAKLHFGGRLVANEFVWAMCMECHRFSFIRAVIRLTLMVSICVSSNRNFCSAECCSRRACIAAPSNLTVGTKSGDMISAERVRLVIISNYSK